MRKLLLSTTMMLMVTDTHAASKPPLALEEINAYQVWEDSGELSDELPKETGEILANGDKGSSVQMIIDTVLTGPKGELVEPGGKLHVWADLIDPPDGQKARIVDQTWPIDFVGMSGEVFRSVIVNHNCQPFDLSVELSQGGKEDPVVTRRFGVFCGD